MLLELRIHNIAIVEELTLPLGSGLTVLTGETGAGKSVIAGALGLLAGRPNPGDLVRSGSEIGYAEGVFDLGEEPRHLERLGELGLRVEADGILVLRRELRPQGRDRVLINGLVSSLGLLKQVGGLLLNIQSQDQQRRLSRPEFACDLLDDWQQNDDLLRAVNRSWGDLRDLLAELEGLEQATAAGLEQQEIWKYQLEELAAAGLDIQEEELLAEQIHFGRNARRLLESAGFARSLLEDADPSLRMLLGQVMGELGRVSGDSTRLQEVLSILEAAATNLDEASRLLEGYLDTCEIDPSRLDEIEARKALYEQLQRKYHRDVSGLLELAAELKEKLAFQDQAPAEMAALQERVEAARAELTAAVDKLHRRRLAGAKKLGPQLEKILRPLGLPAIRCRIDVSLREDPDGPVRLAGTCCAVTECGCDVVQLLVQPNPGEALGPAHRIASGGEKSRIFLGVSVLEGKSEEPPLRLFDEIDAGLGMEGAGPVADLLAELSRQGQVLCITHLATVAARANRHLKVAKKVRDERTVALVQYLEGEERVEELTRLLGGDGVIDDSRHQVAFARKLLEAQAKGRDKSC